MNDRERMLRELDLYPLWVRRDEPAVPAVPADDAAGAAPPAVQAPRSASVTAREPVTAIGEAASGAGAQARPVREMTVTARDDSRPGGPAPGMQADDPARAEAIAQMPWPALKEAVRACTACPLHAQRQQSVFGVGDEAADWLFVGEGPGAEEDARGEPFVGQAGRLLDNMLASIGLARGNDVYIANIVKCRPPGNRTPEPVEARCCEPFLQRQIALLAPRLIVALGKTAAENLLGREASIASLRGRVHDYNGIGMIVTYHPAYLLRNLVDKAKAWEDLCFARDTMQRLKSGDAGVI